MMKCSYTHRVVDTPNCLCGKLEGLSNIIFGCSVLLFEVFSCFSLVTKAWCAGRNNDNHLPTNALSNLCKHRDYDHLVFSISEKYNRSYIQTTVLLCTHTHTNTHKHTIHTYTQLYVYLNYQMIVKQIANTQ